MSTESSRRSRSSWLVPAAVIAVAAILIAIIVALARASEPSAGSQSDATTDADSGTASNFSRVESRDEADLLAAGPVDAPVVLVVFSDYQCPFCARWSAETLPSMMKHAEAGDLRIEWRDVNVFGSGSERAARASYAAAKQGAFWEYHDALFADGGHRSEAKLSEKALTALAGGLKLDVEEFTADLNAEETASQIAANQQIGLDLGAASTPVFILGGEPIVGAQPTEVFEDAFQTALDAAS